MSQIAFMLVFYYIGFMNSQLSRELFSNLFGQNRIKSQNIFITFMNQVEEYIDKISKLLKETQNYVPYSLQCFYTLIKSATLELKQKDVSLEIVGNYANIYKFLRNWLQQPIPDPKERERVFPDLKKMLIPFRKYLARDEVTRSFLRNFEDDQNHRKIREMREQADKICKQLETKNNKVYLSGNSDIAIAFWVGQFKSDYAVHFNLFWEALMEFIKKFSYYQKFISDSSKKTIRQIIDPQFKFLVGMAAINDMFVCLTEPSLLHLLAEQTAKGLKEPKFQSYRTMKLQFHSQEEIDSRLVNEDILIINGEQVAVGAEVTKCRFPQTVRFGSSQDTEVMIKHKFISRRQFMLVQEQDGFSIICLSPSNYTTVTYSRPVELFSGRLFKVGSQIVQVVKINTKFDNILEGTNNNLNFAITTYENTLDYLPENDSVTGSKQLEYKILTGSKKDERGALQALNCNISVNEAEIELIYDKNTFYLPPGIPMLLKTANQVLTGHLSDKLLLEKDMKILLQECSFTVL